MSWGDNNDTKPQLTRRRFTGLLFATAFSWALQSSQRDSSLDDWVCPMHPDVRSDKPGVCPRCGMTLVSHVPDRIEYPLLLSQSPSLLKPGRVANLTLRVL